MIKIYETLALRGSSYSVIPAEGSIEHHVELENAFIQRLSEVHKTEDSLLEALVKENTRKKEASDYKALVQNLLITNGYIV